MSYRISGEADADLKEIYKYTHRTYGRAQADRYYDGLIDRISYLADNPLIARERPEFSPPVRIHPHGRHLIVYRVAGDTVEVVRVLHQAMDVEGAL